MPAGNGLGGGGGGGGMMLLARRYEEVLLSQAFYLLELASVYPDRVAEVPTVT